MRVVFGWPMWSSSWLAKLHENAPKQHEGQRPWTLAAFTAALRGGAEVSDSRDSPTETYFFRFIVKSVTRSYGNVVPISRSN